MSAELSEVKEQLTEAKSQFNKLSLEKQTVEKQHSERSEAKEAEHRQSVDRLQSEIKRLTVGHFNDVQSQSLGMDLKNCSLNLLSPPI